MWYSMYLRNMATLGSTAAAAPPTQSTAPGNEKLSYVGSGRCRQQSPAAGRRLGQESRAQPSSKKEKEAMVSCTLKLHCFSANYLSTLHHRWITELEKQWGA
ncbi:hypothetical protein FN846DRAFT_164354 [Sphaerosporella brunnea]|uniref:Uncharacterized protein n=1 Tax=Sphaerosporella brunnea TaxID=1250544 RepID=A0A5J5EQV9_9PEZI|nr:hypothetical protein FN846DRAFT_164354 [Sphaerosporella brunnea]